MSLINLVKDFINFLTLPYVLFTLATILFVVALKVKKLWEPKVAGTILIVALVAFFASMADENFRLIVTKGDNIPIAAMIFLIGFFAWLAMWQAIQNDQRVKEGRKLIEQEDSEKVLVWPDLVYIEFICLIIASIILLFWSITIDAPLEGPANPTSSPNPSKAPWYFLGLQEMLVYYDPWLAGVVFPSLIIIGLIVLPYLDKNPKGNGYYTFVERPFAITVFLFGFMNLWILLIISGTFLRGPNWNFFGPYEFWDVHKLEPLVNVNLSEFIWVKWFGVGLPENWLLREMFGIVLLVLYFAVPPLVLAKKWFKEMYQRMGYIRYGIMIVLLLLMVALPIKMYLRWLFNLKYLVAIPEFFFNI